MRNGIVAVAATLWLMVVSVSAALTESIIRDYKVKSGETFIINLASNKTTGYSWRFSKRPDKVTVRFIRTIYNRTASRIGAGGVEEWLFKAVKPGTTSINMEYVRPWEAENPAKIATFNVVVE